MSSLKRYANQCVDHRECLSTDSFRHYVTVTYIPVHSSINAKETSVYTGTSAAPNQLHNSRFTLDNAIFQMQNIKYSLNRLKCIRNSLDVVKPSDFLSLKSVQQITVLNTSSVSHTSYNHAAYLSAVCIYSNNTFSMHHNTCSCSLVTLSRPVKWFDSSFIRTSNILSFEINFRTHFFITSRAVFFTLLP